MLTEQQLFSQLLAVLPSDINADAIHAQWQALQPPYSVENRHLPLPVWARRGFTDDGRQAWEILQTEARTRDTERGICLYIHIPFCARRCNFCDCYSFKLKSNRDHHIHRYAALLEQEMRLWANVGTLAQRPVSTVHFGGGTPTMLDAATFRRIVETCQALFNIDINTEWALESTSSELTPAMLGLLRELGFTRLHVGVQSLNGVVRDRLNRQESGEDVRRKLTQARDLGWVVTVDMIFGLPGQTAAGFLADIDDLVELGVDGFSLYELQISHRNRHFAQEHGLTERPRLQNYVMAQAGGLNLAKHGFRKTLFNHYAGVRDTNLYFTFPERGEDCLALGTIADGVFGNYHYRHPEYAPYSRSVTASFPGLQGGLRRTSREELIQPLTTALLAARIPTALLSSTAEFTHVQQWLERALIAEEPATGDFLLTGNGSWFAGNMISSCAQSISTMHDIM